MKMRRIQLSMLLLIFMVFTISCQTGNSSQYQELSQRVEKLEKMLGPMSKTLELEASARQERYHQRYIQRSQADKSIYSQDQLDDAEKMYQKANGKGWRTNEAKVSLEKMIEKYPLCNRAGCGTLYLAQWATGVEKEKLLLKAIQKYNDSYYGDGVQVGAYARIVLAEYYEETGQKEKADKLCAELKADFLDAIDHKGNLLSEP